MSFTTEDLKRLKEDIELANRQPCPMIHIDTDTQSALLARLEAAEDCVRLFAGYYPKTIHDKEALEAWRKSKGE